MSSEDAGAPGWVGRGREYPQPDRSDLATVRDAVERKLVKECSRAVAIYLGLQGKTSCNALETSELAFMCLSCGLA